MNIQKATLCFLRNNEHILLGMKKRGFGMGKWNGFGGKVNVNENPIAAAKREVIEEIGIEIKEIIEKGFINFHYETHDVNVWLYEVTSWQGNPTESEEMRPEWFKISEIPYTQMWPDDVMWLPLYLKNQKINAEFWFDNDFIITKSIFHN